MSTDSRGLATSLFKALDTLNMLSARPGGLAIREVVEGMGLPRSSLIRILDSLMHYGLVERGEDKRYRVTGKFREWRLASRDDDLVADYREVMRRIADRVGEMAILGQIQGRLIRHLHYEEPDCRVRVAPPIGRKIPLERMAMGKLVLSQRPDLLPKDCSPVLRREIELARELGEAWNRGESEAGIVAWGTWLGPPSPLTPMIAVTWPDFRFSEAALSEVKRLLE
jgi:DNA-binding IclR family transcriptional regulator